MDMQLEQLGAKIRAQLDVKHKAREVAIPKARQVIRSSSLAIRAIHRGSFDEADKYLDAAKSALVEAQQALEPYPQIYYAGFLQDAEKEYSEAMATSAFVRELPIPDPDEIGVGYPPFLSGLGEAMGELRRFILDKIRVGKLTEGEKFLTVMDDFYYFLFSFDYPDAVTPGLRRNTDLARSVMEKTRGDLTASLRQHSLNIALERLESKIDAGQKQ
jgi:translin